MAITIENVRFSYCNLFQPQARPGQAEAKYSVTILVPKPMRPPRPPLTKRLPRQLRPEYLNAGMACAHPSPPSAYTMEMRRAPATDSRSEKNAGDAGCSQHPAKISPLLSMPRYKTSLTQRKFIPVCGAM